MLIDANLTLMTLRLAIAPVAIIRCRRRIEKSLDRKYERFSAIEKSLSEVKSELTAQSQRLDDQFQPSEKLGNFRHSGQAVIGALQHA